MINLEDQLPYMSYKDLWGISKANISLSRQAAEEIRRRRKTGGLPEVNNLCTPTILNERQKEIYQKVIDVIGSIPNTEILITGSVLEGGWKVYLTGEDNKLLDDKISISAEMVAADVREFGSCRVFVIPINKEYVGLKICYDRGLRCVYPRA